MREYTVALLGLGPRGIIHLHGFHENKDRFRVVGVCDRHAEKREEAARRFHLPPAVFYDDAEAMLAACRPDVFCFVTMPRDRLALVELGIKYGVKGMLLEKPLANTLAEAAAMTAACRQHGIKAIVCTQHKYLRSFLKLREILDSGALGTVTQIQSACQAHAAQLGCHYLDYMLWANNGARAVAVAGHAHGGFFLKDSHPAPDYSAANIAYENGVRGLFECGYFSPRHAEHDAGFAYSGQPGAYWTDDRLTVLGEKGYAWAECNGRWAACLPGSDGLTEGFCGEFDSEQWLAQIPYTADFARWLDEDGEAHSCRIENAYHIMETLQGIYLSALDHVRADLPLAPELAAVDALARMERELNAVEYKRF